MVQKIELIVKQSKISSQSIISKMRKIILHWGYVMLNHVLLLYLK